MTTLPGGWIADRLIGPQNAVLYGGILIAAATSAWPFPRSRRFYVGLVLIVIGTGLLKGNVSVIVGQLYDLDDERRDAGYSIYYMGINTGAFIAPLICGYLGQRVDWHMGFGAAGVGMTIGLIQYVLGRKHLGDAGRFPAQAASPEAGAQQRRQVIFGISISTAVIVLGGLAISMGLLLYADTVGRRGRILPARPHRGFLWMAVSRSWMDTSRAQTALRRRRALSGSGALLV